MFSRVDAVGAVVDSSLGSQGLPIPDLFEGSLALRGPWQRLRTCIIPVKILVSTNSKSGVPWLTGSK